MRGHTDQVWGVAHLPDGQCIITCSDDGTLRLWERESGAQIGNAWEDEEDDNEYNKRVLCMALSPNGKTVATGHMDGEVKLWDMEMQKVTAKWTGHTKEVWAVCWSGNGRHVVSGSYDGTATVWNAESGGTVLGPIETGHQKIDAVAFSPDTSNFATGGYDQDGIKIWDARTGELLSTLEQDSFVRSLVWTSDQKKLLAGDGDGSITIFNTATWQQIALLEDHHSDHFVLALSLFHNDRLLASGSYRNARLWNLDTNLPVGPPLQHQDWINDMAFSADGRFLATACDDDNTYVWDVHAILQEAGLEHLLSSSNVTAGKSILNADATRHPKKSNEHPTVAPRRFFDSPTPLIDPPPPTVRLDPPPATPHADLPPAHHDAPPSTRVRHRLLAPFTLAGARALIGRISSRFNRSQPSTVQPTELQQFSRPGDISVQGPVDGEVSAAQGCQSRASSNLARLEHPPKPSEHSLHRSQDHIIAPVTLAGARALLGRISSRFSHSQPWTVQPTKLQQFSSLGNVSVHAPANSGVQDNQFDATLPLATLQHPTDEITGQHYNTPSIHLPTPHPLVNHTATKSAADTGGRMTNPRWRRPSPNIKGKQKQRRPDRSAPKVVGVPLGKATYGAVVVNRKDVVPSYSLFCCLSWCQKKDERQDPPPQQYDTDMYPQEENATPSDSMPTTEFRPTTQQEQPEAGPSRLPGSAEC